MLAPFVSGFAVKDSADIDVRLSINGEVRQESNSREMLYPIIPLIQHMAGQFALQPGDVVLTGTPAGVGPLQAGDELLMEIPGHTAFSTFVLPQRN